MNFIKRLASFVVLLLAMALLPILAQDETRTLVYEDSISSEQPFIEYPVSIPSNGRLVADMQAADSNGLDGLLFLVDSAENIVIDNDDRSRDDRNPYLEVGGLAAGEYKLIATRFDVAQGESAGDFRLSVSISPNASSTPPLDLSEEAMRASGYPRSAPQERRPWTIFAYYGGDNNLEEGILDDLQEFELGGGSDEMLNIVVFVDRHPDYYEGLENWSDARIFYVQDGTGLSGDELATRELATLGDLDSGSPQTLAQFLAWGIQHYPAERYALAFGGHGEGWRGLVPDYTSSNLIGVRDLQAALQAVTSAYQMRFELLINDACLMGSVEYLSAMSQFFNYALVSPEIVYNPALDMAQLARTLRQSPSVPLPELGQQLVDIYIERDMARLELGGARYTTAAMFDLSRFSEVQRSLDDLALLVTADPNTYLNTLIKARNQSFAYPQTSADASLLDLGDFLNNILENSLDRYLVASVKAVQDAIQASLVHANRAPQALTSAYLNVYFPSSRKSFDPFYYSRTTLTGWLSFLRAYFDTLDPQDWRSGSSEAFHATASPQVRILARYPQAAAPDQYTQFSVQVVGRSITSGSWFVDGPYELTQADGTRTQARVRWLSEPVTNCVATPSETTCGNLWDVGVGQYTYDLLQTYYQLADEQQAHPVSLLMSDNQEVVDGYALLRGQIQARYRLPNAEAWDSATLLYREHYDSTSEVFSWVYDGAISRSAAGGLAPVNIPLGAQVETQLAVVGADGLLSYVPGQVFTWNAQGLQLAEVPMPAGNYEVGMQVYGFGDSMGQDSTTVTVLDAASTASDLIEIDLEGNYALSLPTGWRWIRSPGSNQRTILDENGGTLADVFIVEEYLENLFLIQAYYSQQRWGSIYEEDVNDDSFIYFSDDRGVGLVFVTLEPTVLVRFYGDFETAAAHRDLFVAGLQTDLLDDSEFFGDWASLNDPQRRYRLRFPDAWWQEIDEETYDSPLSQRGPWLEIAPPEADRRAEVMTLTVQDAAQALDALWRDLSADYEQATLESKRRYRAENNLWEVILYRATIDSNPYRGRLYLAQQDGLGYAINLQALDDAALADVWPNALEPIVDSFEVRPALLRHTDYDLGYQLPYPSSWWRQATPPEPASADAVTIQTIFSSISPNGLRSLSVLLLNGTRSNAEGVLEAYAASESLTLTADPAIRSLDGREGLVFDFTRRTSEGFTERGRGLAYYDESRQQGLVFLAASASYALTEYQENFERLIVEGVRLFDAITTAYRPSSTPYIAPFFRLKLPPNLAAPLEFSEEYYSVRQYNAAFCEDADECLSITFYEYPVALNPEYVRLEDHIDLDMYSNKRQIMLDSRVAWRAQFQAETDTPPEESLVFYLPETQTVIEVLVSGSSPEQAEAIFSTLRFTYEVDFDEDNLLANVPVAGDPQEVVRVESATWQEVEPSPSSLFYVWEDGEVILSAEAFFYPDVPPNLADFALTEGLRRGFDVDSIAQTLAPLEWAYGEETLVFSSYYADSRDFTRLVYGLLTRTPSAYYVVLLDADELSAGALDESAEALCQGLFIEDEALRCDPAAFVNPLLP